MINGKRKDVTWVMRTLPESVARAWGFPAICEQLMRTLGLTFKS